MSFWALFGPGGSVLVLLGTFWGVFGPSGALLGDFLANKCENVCFLILMPLSHGINVFEVWGCQVGARWVQREPLGGHVETLWAHLGVTMGIFGALLASLFPGPFPRPVFGLVSAVVRLSCGPGASGSGALGGGGIHSEIPCQDSRKGTPYA